MEGACELKSSKRITRLALVRKEWKTNWQSYILAFPAIGYTLIFGYATLPFLVIAFQRFSVSAGLFKSDWVGLDNFRAFFISPRWISVTLNTVSINFFNILVSTLLAILVSMILNELRFKRFVKITQSTFLFPHFLSWVVVGYFVYALFASELGMINQILKSLGVKPVAWYSTPDPWQPILIGLRVWKGFGFNVVIFLAAITGIDASLYEAAMIDGASRARQNRYITLPLLMPTVSIVVIMAVGRIFYGDFGMVYSIIRDNSILYPTTDVIDTYVYRLLRKTGDPAQSMAVSIYQSVLGFIMVYAANALARKIDKDSSLF